MSDTVLRTAGLFHGAALLPQSAALGLPGTEGAWTLGGLVLDPVAGLH